MGSIRYDGDTLHFEDRLLAHLQIVLVQKLRAAEPFLMSWVNATAAGSGRTSIWIQPGVPLRFDFDGSRGVSIDRDWLQTLQRSASSPTGLIVTGEDGRVALCDVRAPAGRRVRPLT